MRMPRLARVVVPGIPHHACLCVSHADRCHNAGIAGCRRSFVTKTTSFVDRLERLLRPMLKPQKRGPKPKPQRTKTGRQRAART